MNKRAWWATVHGVAQLGTTGQKTLYPFDQTMKYHILYIYINSHTQQLKIRQSN